MDLTKLKPPPGSNRLAWIVFESGTRMLHFKSMNKQWDWIGDSTMPDLEREDCACVAIVEWTTIRDNGFESIKAEHECLDQIRFWTEWKDARR